MINILVILYIEQKFEIITRGLDLIMFHRIMRCIDNTLFAIHIDMSMMKDHLILIG